MPHRASFSEIYQRHAALTDKGTVHTYLEFYEAAMAEYRHQPVTLLEIGIGRGGSLSLWRDYLHPASRIIGVDIAPARPLGGNVEILQADATRDGWTKGIGPLDIVIDDGSHRAADQIATCRLLWPLLRPGGLYIVEDIQNDAAEQAVREAMPGAVAVDWRAIKQRHDDRIVWAKKR